MKVTELQPTDSRKSFYGKALLIHDGNNIKLQSYDTIVARFDGETVKINGWYSSTTARHINSFLAYLNKPQLTKKDMKLKPIL